MSVTFKEEIPREKIVEALRHGERVYYMTCGGFGHEIIDVNSVGSMLPKSGKEFTPPSWARFCTVTCFSS